MRLFASLVRLVTASAFSLLLASSVESATIVLDFSGSTAGGGNGEPILQTYGDGATYDVTYTTRDAAGNSAPTGLLHYWNAGYGSLLEVAYCCGTGFNIGDLGEIAIIPTAGYSIQLNSFDLAGWSSDTDTRFTVYDGGYNELVPDTTIVAPDTGWVTVAFTNLVDADGIVLQWGPQAYYAAIDNVSFTVSPIGPTTVPEPSTLALLSIGAAGAVRRRYRNR